MKNRIYILGLALITLTACRVPMNVSNVQPQQNQLLTTDIPLDAEMTEVIEPYKERLGKVMGEKISFTSVDLTKTGDNSNLGNLLADYTFEGGNEWAKKNGIASGVDAAVINVGGIRTNIGKGDILRRHIFEVMPFENEIVIMKMQGKDLQGLFDYYAATQKNNPVAGLTVETEDGKIVQQSIAGKPLDPNRTYYIVTSDYLALGGDNMNYFQKGEMIATGIKMRDLFIEKFTQNPEVKVPEDIRLNFKNKSKKP